MPQIKCSLSGFLLSIEPSDSTLQEIPWLPESPVSSVCLLRQRFLFLNADRKELGVGPFPKLCNLERIHVEPFPTHPVCCQEAVDLRLDVFRLIPIQERTQNENGPEQARIGRLH